MLKGRLHRTRIFLCSIMYSLPLLAFALAGYFRFVLISRAANSPKIDRLSYIGLTLLATGIWAVAVEHFHLYDIAQLFSPSGKTKRTFLACFVTYFVLLALTFFYRQTSFSREFIFASAAFLFMLATVARVLFRIVIVWRANGNGDSARILIAGTDGFASRAARALQISPVVPCKVVGFIHLPGQSVAVTGAPIHELEDIPHLAVGNGIDDVVLAIPPTRFTDVSDLLSKLEPLCTPVRLALDLGENIVIHEKLFNFGNAVMLDLRPTPAESPSYLILKRAFDIAFSLLVLIFTAPLSAIIAVAIKLTSPGPIFFVQERVGLNGRTFRMYKFRTMQAETSKRDSDVTWTTALDPRRTAVGRALRRTSLDELPQFLNVLRGEMSVVGPRPERPYFVQKFLQDIDSYNKRHALKVGITGWAQVNGWRGDTSINRRVEFDLYYLKNWSLTLDLQIICLTIVRGLLHRNAY